MLRRNAMAEPAFLTRRLGTVTAAAARSPVSDVPEQRRISLVRDHVINAVGSGNTAGELAVGAERMLSQEGFGGSAPAVVVAAIVRAEPSGIGSAGVLVAVATSSEAMTAGTSAWMQRTSRHMT
jgi:hypothetical protein